MQGGTRVRLVHAGAGAPNVIPDEVQLSGTIRALTNTRFGQLRSRVVEVSRGSVTPTPCCVACRDVGILERHAVSASSSAACHLWVGDLLLKIQAPIFFRRGPCFGVRYCCSAAPSAEPEPIPGGDANGASARLQRQLHVGRAALPADRQRRRHAGHGQSDPVPDASVTLIPI